MDSNSSRRLPVAIVAIVTGDPGGLGSCIAARLAKRPSEVVLVDSEPASGGVRGVRTETADWNDVAGLQTLIDRLAAARLRVRCLAAERLRPVGDGSLAMTITQAGLVRRHGRHRQSRLLAGDR